MTLTCGTHSTTWSEEQRWPAEGLFTLTTGTTVSTAAWLSPSNVFHWTRVKLNVPGMSDYNPGKPWICKLRANGDIAADMHLFVDDGRTTGPTEEDAWQGGSKVAKMSAWYGLQDAARKRRPPSQTPGAWSGSVVATTADGVFLSVSQERWDKTKTAVQWIAAQLGNNPVEIEFKPLERFRGFLVYVGQTYRAMVPYLQGIHLTLDSWRPNRDDKEWRLARSAWPEELDSAVNLSVEDPKAPERVKTVECLASDVDALLHLTHYKKPPQVTARPSSCARVVIGFGDALGNGFGVSEADNKGGYQAI
ncbi:hypothetical protein MPSEU_000875500 [Mayamaea pseudoterrestris]|nr:hypothetical protein MPSEU_000875500 [Mayamaea pseudoterrestris]